MRKDSELAVLIMIVRTGGSIAPSQIRSRTGLSDSAVSTRLRRLERDGLVERPSRGHYVGTKEGYETVVEETDLDMGLLLADRVARSEDAALGRRSTIVIQYPSATIVEYSTSLVETEEGDEDALDLEPERVAAPEEIESEVDGTLESLLEE